MNRKLLSIVATVLLATFSYQGWAQVAGDEGTFECRAVQVDAIAAVADGAPYRNHGQLVRTAANTVSEALEQASITEACSSCIVSQFARRLPVDLQEPCGPDAQCGDGICSIGEDFYGCPLDCGAYDLVGESLVPIPLQDACGFSRPRTCESLIGNVVLDATLETHAVDFAIMNSGTIRADLTCPETDDPLDTCPSFVPPPYPISRGQVFAVLPFMNEVVTLNVNGSELKAMLENGVSVMPIASGRFPQVAGLCFTYDISAAVGSRVIGAVRQAPDGSCTGASIDLTSGATYLIAENDFMLLGGDGYPDFSGRETVHGILDQVVSDWLSANSPVLPAIQGRINCVTSGVPACPVVVP